jgi:dTDP-4-dehydrorhamnose reductase
MREYCPRCHGKRNDSLKLLITGASGLLGTKLVELALKARHEVSSVYNEHPTKGSEAVRVELRDAEAVRSMLTSRAPDVVIHTASITDVDFCERSPSLAMDINGKATGIIADVCRELSIFLVYVSSDYVFDGQTGHYGEEDRPNPINAYGRSKLLGERMVSDYAGDYCTTRTSVLFGCGREHRSNFGTWLLEQLTTGQNVSVINGQYASPTLSTHLARMLLEVAEKRITGIIHLAGADRMNRYEFAVRFAQEFGFNAALVVPISADPTRWHARRPTDSSLNVERAIRLLDMKPMTVDDELREFKLELRER